MRNREFLYLSIEVSENQTLEQKIKEVVEEIESYDWNVVAYDINPHEVYKNRYIMTVYMEKEE
jgi:hypothetical protein